MLLAEGAESPRVFTRLHDHLESILPDVQRLEIPYASHLMHEDNEPVFNRAVLEFLSSLREQPPWDCRPTSGCSRRFPSVTLGRVRTRGGGMGPRLGRDRTTKRRSSWMWKRKQEIDELK